MKKSAFMLFIILMASMSFVPSALAEEERELQGEIIYNIMVDRYNNGNSMNDDQVDIENPDTYHGGDIEGIIARLDALEEIGVTTISLSPLMNNGADGYHGYWIEDFYSMEEQFGTFDDLDMLIAEAHDRGMKVVMEFVTNYIAKSNPIADEPEKEDWMMDHGLTDPAWTANTAGLNLANPEVETYLIDTAKYWMSETDLDGFKLHAVDEASIDFLGNFTKQIKDENPNFYLLGDILFNDEASEELLERTELDAVENMEMKESMTEVFAEPDQPVSNIYETWANTSNENPLLYLDDFYTERFTQIYSENQRNSLTTWTLALTYMYTTPGIPTLLQGTELPMYGATEEETQRLVPFNSGEPELKEFHDRISSLREQFPVLQYGDFEIVGSDGAMSVFKRTLDDETMYIAINNGSESAYVDVTDMDSGMQLRGFLGDNLVRENENGEYRIGLPRESSEVYSVQEDAGLNWIFIGFVLIVFILFVIGIIALSIKQKKRMAE
ncbi:alpha-amylase family glycosyl hydrolase [Oceanobacillus massiliensis]|uniref:alpha-amylase family glycosyl hydrolase n=1 Tax=Oceanobacillus massiliensis TaxID=1465765 RepID=UPI000287C2DD|nr:alpha-amylase family glycosyl hydrolase [Oceanobacillus massiliensis]